MGLEQSPELMGNGIPPLWTRRNMIARMGGGLGALGLANVLQSETAVAAPGTHRVAGAKRVIQLFMNGGPFQADFFDPKPALARFEGQRPKEVDLRTERATAGLLASPFRFRPCGQSGVPVSELLPRLSGCIDDICVLRSLHTDNPNHGPALYMMNNGTITPKRPSMGAWFLYGLGSENENLPGYVVLCPGRPVRFAELWNSAFLPAEFQGTYVNHAKIDPQKMIPFLRNDELARPEQRRQLDLIQALNERHRNNRSIDGNLEARITSLESAFRMQFEAGDAFDLSQEPAAIREEYGEGRFADGCLLARRLAERGVRFIQVYYGDGQPWDTHQKHTENVRKLAADIDRPTAALLTDLKRRGLLEDTLVMWGGEFGRTPTAQGGDGRDHNPHAFTWWFAGGGMKPGFSHGESDDYGYYAAINKVHVHDLHATLLHLLGLDHERLTYRHAGRDFRLTDVEGRVVREVLA